MWVLPLWLGLLAIFIFAWMRFMNAVNPPDNDDDYMMGDEDPDEGDRS